MHPLLRFALLLCPSDYRRHYRASIADDVLSRGVNPAVAALDLLHQALTMRVEGVARDFSYALRSLARTPMYAVVASLTIALAIAANVAVASVLDGVLLHPLPYPDSGRIVHISENAGQVNDFSYLDARDLGAQAGGFEHFGISNPERQTLTRAGGAALLRGEQVDAGYLAVLGARPELGRIFTNADLGTHRIIISDATWRGRFGARPDVIGSTAQLNGVNYTIVGVLPPRFRGITTSGLLNSEYWMPIDPRSNVATQRGYQTFDGWGLLRKSFSVQSAQADVTRIMGGIMRRYPQAHQTGWTRSEVVSALDLVVGPVKTMLWMLYAAVALLLVIACANVTNLTLVRAAARERELNVRAALGASRARLAAQLCTEMAIISAIGGIGGILLGWFGLRLFGGVASQMIPRWDSVHVDASVVGYVVLLLAITTIVTGVLPALAGRRDLVAGLKAAGRSGDASGGRRLRSALVVAEIALAIAVVAAAGLVVRSFVTLTHVSLGFDSTNVYVVHAPDMPKSRYPSFASSLLTAHRILDDIRKVPGVTDATITTDVPFDGNFTVSTNIPGQHNAIDTPTNAVAPGYFAVLHIPLLRGRDFNGSDRQYSQQVAIVTASFARRYFHTLYILGKTFRPEMSSANTPEVRTIVGVVGDTRNSFSEPITPSFYVPDTQIHGLGRFVVRTDGRNAGFAAEMTKVYAQVDPQFAPPLVSPYAELFARDAGRAQAAAMLFSALALIALILSLAGIYAVTAYSVEQRTQEFGVRKAVGAKNGAVLNNVLGSALRQSAAGIVIGLGLVALLARLLVSILFQTSPFDPLTFGAVVTLLVACTLLAAAIPALRATRVQPSVALRYE